MYLNIRRGAMFKWVKRRDDGEESRGFEFRVGSACDWQTLFVNPAVNGIFFRIREG